MLLPDLPVDHLPAHREHPDDPDFGLVPIPRLLQVEDYLDYVANRVCPTTRSARPWRSCGAPRRSSGTEHQRQPPHRLPDAVADGADCADACGVNLPEALAEITDKAFMIVVQDFQDPYTLNVRQLMKCCVEEITPDGRLIPFCAYNSVGYREQVRAQHVRGHGRRRGAQRHPLQPMLADSPYGSKIAAAGGSTSPTVAVDAAMHPGSPMSAPWTPQTLKACCAAGYSSDLVSLLLGTSPTIRAGSP